MACEPEDVMSGAQTLCCIPPALHAAVQSYLLARIRGGSMDVNEIVRETACQFSCTPPGLLPRIRTYLMCQLSNTGGGVIPEPECDADALAFIAAAGITVQAQKDAICRFVNSLKTQGTPPFWDSEVLLYPFVGGTAASHSINLRSPGTFTLAYVGGITHSNLGMLGNTVNGYANPGYIPSVGPPAMSNTDARVYGYIDSISSTANDAQWGNRSNASARRILDINEVASHRLQMQEGASGPVFAYANGGYLANLRGGVRSCAYNGGAFLTPGYVNTGPTTNNLLLLAFNSNAIAPAINAAGFSASRMSGFSIGSRGLTAAEWPVYHSIWQTFQAELGRQRP